MPPELKRKLKKVLAGRSSVDMGQFQFLNLERVREEAGADWDRLREKVYEVGNHFIEKRLDDGDAVIRCRGGFLIIFESLEAEAAAAAVAGIAADLEAFFLGDRVLRHLEVAGEARSVTTEELLEIVARNQDEGAVPAAPPPAEDRKEASRERTGWVEVRHADSRLRRSGRIRPEALYKEADGVWDDIVFKPCWDAHGQALVHNICVARRVVKGFAYYGRDTLLGADARDLHRQLDQSVARAAQRGFQKVYAQGRACAVVVPVHYDTISTVSQRLRYFAILQSVPESMRRYFFLRVDGIPDGAPLGQMQELFRSMKHFGAYVLAQLKFGATDLRRFEGCGIGIFSAETPSRMNEAGPADAQLAGLADWVAAARLMRAETGLATVEGVSALEAGLSAGVRYFSGALIAPELALPAPVRPLGLPEIMGHGKGGQGVRV
jgi:hypothetical protein